MNKSLFVFLAALTTFSEAGLYTYRYDVTINDAFGSLDANTVLTGKFTFDSEQSGTDINGVSNAKRFELSALSLSTGNESIKLSFAPGNDGWMVVGDDSPALSGEDFFTVRAEGNPAFTGTLGGLAVDTLYLVWTDTNGSANDGFALPLDETTFNEYENATIQLQGVSGNILSITANTKLISRLGGRAVFDADLNITWIADANLAASNTFGLPGINTDGTMSWDTANSWIAAMNAADYLGFSDWRLPITTQPDSSCIAQVDAGTAFPVQGAGTGCTGSEMGHLYNIEGVTATLPVPFSNIAVDTNFVSSFYWSGTEFAPSAEFEAWGFNFDTFLSFDGHQSSTLKTFDSYVWAVRTGDVSSVPTLDNNGDGISDADAIALGLDPNDPDGDTDNDGLSDVNEVGDIHAPMDNDGDGVIDALEPGPDASNAEIASGLLLVSGDTVTIKTEPGEMLSQVSATEATGSPSGIKFPYGMVSYITTSPVGGSVTVRITFSANLPNKLVIEKVDRANNYTSLPDTVWNQVGERSVDITLTDGDPLTDLDGTADGSIDDPVAVGNNAGGSGDGGGGCTIGLTSNVDPVWLFILFVSGVGYLRRRRLGFIEVPAKKAT